MHCAKESNFTFTQVHMESARHDHRLEPVQQSHDLE